MWEPPPPSANSSNHSHHHHDEFQLCKSAFRLGEFDLSLTALMEKQHVDPLDMIAASLPKHLLLIKQVLNCIWMRMKETE